MADEKFTRAADNFVTRTDANVYRCVWRVLQRENEKKFNISYKRYILFRMINTTHEQRATMTYRTHIHGNYRFRQQAIDDQQFSNWKRRHQQQRKLLQRNVVLSPKEISLFRWNIFDRWLSTVFAIDERWLIDKIQISHFITTAKVDWVRMLVGRVKELVMNKCASFTLVCNEPVPVNHIHSIHLRWRIHKMK